MTVIFYCLYILLTPARWSWLWFMIAVLILFTDSSFRMFQRLVDEERDDINYWKGPHA